MQWLHPNGIWLNSSQWLQTILLELDALLMSKSNIPKIFWILNLYAGPKTPVWLKVTIKFLIFPQSMRSNNEMKKCCKDFILEWKVHPCWELFLQRAWGKKLRQLFPNFSSRAGFKKKLRQFSGSLDFPMFRRLDCISKYLWRIKKRIEERSDNAFVISFCTKYCPISHLWCSEL